MDAGMRGTNAAQDSRFKDKEAASIKATKFPKHFSEKVDLRKVNLAVLRSWIATKVTELIKFEDDVVVEYVFGMLEDKDNPTPDPKKMQISLVGFMDKHGAAAFMDQLWKLLLSAQSTVGGVPAEFIEAKKAELQAQQLKERAAQDSRVGRNDGRSQAQDSFDRRRDGPGGLPARPAGGERGNYGRRSPPPRDRDRDRDDSYNRRGPPPRRDFVPRERDSGYGPRAGGGGGGQRDRSRSRSRSPPRGYGYRRRSPSPPSRRRSPSPSSRRRSPSPVNARRRSPPPRRRSPSPVRRRSPPARRRASPSPKREMEKSVTPPLRRKRNDSPPRRSGREEERGRPRSRSRTPTPSDPRTDSRSRSRSRSRSPTVTPPRRRRRSSTPLVNRKQPSSSPRVKRRRPSPSRSRSRSRSPDEAIVKKGRGRFTVEDNAKAVKGSKPDEPLKKSKWGRDD